MRPVPSIFERARGRAQASARRLDAALEGFLGRRPGLTRGGLTFWGFLVLLLVAVLAAGFGAAVGGRSVEEVVYAARDGSIVAVEPVSGEALTVYEGSASEEASRFAFVPTTAGGLRWLAFSVLRGGLEEGSPPRADLYTVDPVRQARARLTGAVPGEVFTDPALSPARSRILAVRHESGAPPNVAVMPRSGSRVSLLEPDLESAAPILSAVWISDDALFAWRASSSSPETLSLTAHDLGERRRVTVYETENELVGPLSYHRDSNTAVLAERPRGAPLEKARLKLLVGDEEIPLAGAGDGLGLYDPSPPTRASVMGLDGQMAVLWTDGEEEWGVGLLDPESWSFRKTAVRVEPESRHPQISPDGLHVATYDEKDDAITVRRLQDGGLVRRIEGAQPPETALARLQESGFEVPPEAS